MVSGGRASSPTTDWPFEQSQDRKAGPPLVPSLHPADFSRKLLLCLLEQNKLEDAAETFHSMDESTREEPMTLYLGFKLGLRMGDHQLASQCLESLSEQTPKDPRYLYACTVDARSAADKIISIKSLEHLSTRHELSPSSPVHIPALLRSIIRLQKHALDGEECAGSLCHTFERGKKELYHR